MWVFMLHTVAVVKVLAVGDHKQREGSHICVLRQVVLHLTRRVLTVG